MRPTTCVVAADEPEIAAKIEQPTTLTCSSRPGSSPAHGASPWNSERDRRDWNRISPIRMNIGSASSSCVVRMFQAYCASSLARGIVRNSAGITAPVAPSVSPIQMPPASAENRIANMVPVTVPMGLRYSYSWLFHRRGLDAVIFQRQAEQRLDGAREELQRQQHHAERDHGLRD